MKPPENMEAIIGRKRYSTRTATLLAGNDFWDGCNWERNNRNMFLYRTKNGRYFRVMLTRWKGEKDSLTPMNEEDAMELFEALEEKRVTQEEAFPGVTIEEA